MYNPSRGGVRGGADQFTWESVKTDKHRENYLGHSLMAPVGRWQKGKDLSWYAKERKDDKTQELIDKSEMASIKKAEEEAMLIALGHNIVRKTQTLTKEDMREALKRNTERDDHHIERIDGIGSTSHRIAALSGVRKDARHNNEGVSFETVRERNISEANNSDKGSESISGERKKSKKSKKHKKEKKHKKHHRQSQDSDVSEDSSKYKTKYQKNESDGDIEKSLKVKHSKKSKHRYEEYSDSPDSDNEKSSKLKKHKLSKTKTRDHIDSDSSDSNERKSSMKHSKKSKHRCEEYSDSPHSDNEKSSKLKKYKSSKAKSKNHVGSDSSDSSKRKSSKVKSHKEFKVKHHSSESDSSADTAEYKTKNKKRHSDYAEKITLKEKSYKKSKHRHKDYSSDSDEKSHTDSEKRGDKRHKKQKECVKRRRHDTSESD